MFFRRVSLLSAGFLYLSFAPLAAQTVSFADTTTVTPFGGATPCTAPALVTLNVPTPIIIQDLDFRVLIQHDFRTDTNLTLTSPAGTSVDLLTGPFTNGNDNYVVRFDDDAAIVVDSGAHGSQGLGAAVLPVQSEGDPLSLFDGEDAQGDWTISICDIFVGADDGELREIELFVTPIAQLTAEKTVTPLAPDGFSLPGTDLIYTITLMNTTDSAVDEDTLLVIDALPPEMIFFNGDADGPGPLTDAVSFQQAGSALSFDPLTDVGFSNLPTRPAGFDDCSYSPTLGLDPLVTFICVNPKGIFGPGDPNPTAAITFRARIR